MAGYVGPTIENQGLVLYLDSTNNRSFPGNGTDWNDLTSRGNNASLNSVSVRQNIQRSMRFEGSAKSIVPNNSSLIIGTKPFTLDVWFYPESGGGTVVSKGNSAAAGTFSLAVENDDIVFKVGTRTVFSHPVVYDQWNNVSVIRMSTLPDMSKLLLNSKLVKLGTISEDLSNSENLYVGSGRGGLSNFFNGDITVVRLYNDYILSETTANYFSLDQKYNTVAVEQTQIVKQLDGGPSARMKRQVLDIAGTDTSVIRKRFDGGSSSTA